MKKRPSMSLNDISNMTPAQGSFILNDQLSNDDEQNGEDIKMGVMDAIAKEMRLSTKGVRALSDETLATRFAKMTEEPQMHPAVVRNIVERWATQRIEDHEYKFTEA